MEIEITDEHIQQHEDCPLGNAVSLACNEATGDCWMTDCDYMASLDGKQKYRLPHEVAEWLLLFNTCQCTNAPCPRPLIFTVDTTFNAA